MAQDNQFILTLSCRDTTGIVHAVSGLLYQGGCNIMDSQQFGDLQGDDATGLFFMRVHFVAPPHLANLGALQTLFDPARRQFGMALGLFALARHPRVMLMVSQHAHCLNDLLFRWRSGQLGVDIAAIVSNHATLAALAESYGIALHRLPLPSFKGARPYAQAHARGVKLARAVRRHVEHRVLMNGHKTVVFR
jgi:formyltetrahydrofolate deformylase